MPTFGIELSDAGLLAASCEDGDPRLIEVADRHGHADWPGFCWADGPNLMFGRSAEDMWFVHPRQVIHNFWARLAHEPSGLLLGTKPPAFSELAFFFLREFASRLPSGPQAPDRLVLAIPPSYLKDPATEEEKVGLLLGMAMELKLPLAGLIDLGCAALCAPHAPGFNHTMPVVVLDLGLDGADITLFTTQERLERREYLHLPHTGLAQLLKQLTGTMGNRFLKHTSFDILEDGRIEQVFFRQTKEFLLGEMAEHRFVINTATRTYEMIAKRDQLAADAQPFLQALAQGLVSFLRQSRHAATPCTIALTERAACLPGLQARLRAAGFSRLLRLPPGAAACGAARIGANRLRIPADLADAPLLFSAPLAETRSLTAHPWTVQLRKAHDHSPRPAPTHAILHGHGHPLAHLAQFTIGLAGQAADLILPDTFSTASDCSLLLEIENGRPWFTDPLLDAPPGQASSAKTAIETGDHLIFRWGDAQAEILFAHCPAAGTTRAP